MEFLLSEEKVKPLLKKSVRKKIVKAALKEFNLIFDGSDEEKNKLSDDIKEKISGAISKPPLMVKLDHLIDRLEIPIKESDKNDLNLIRKRRNDVVHGREMKGVGIMDIWRANAILGLIIAFKMKNKGGN